MIACDQCFEVRPITESDLLEVLEVYQQCEDFLALGAEPAASMAMVQQDIEISRRKAGVYCGIYTATGRMIGVIDFIPGNFEGNPEHAFLSLLMIAPAYRRQGIGAKIIRLVEKEIQQNPQIRRIFSAVQINNPRALKFWQKNCYQVISGPELQADHTVTLGLRKDLSDR
jgi:ribosomal protein S18 acetylase RimI-like enzyme